MPGMFCVDDLSTISLQGSNGISGGNGDSLTIEYVRCVDKPHCKSEPEINDFIKRHRMFVIYNDQTYLTENFGSETVNSDV